ncbi:chromate efflux transporter [Roseateles terrae]|uniref:Chromate transporter n=1 Tax=Roseateles terrae TaxID=431060 RepID=A0ABR6GR75_9BURK|nr:chromate transporter [Roseateles terrae]
MAPSLAPSVDEPPERSSEAPASSPATPPSEGPGSRPTGSALEVLRAFLVLGLTSFGGPVAHLGYFRAEFVERRRWLSEADYADLVALCQCLPGPTSSQVGMGLGLQRAGGAGALAAWVGFTMPSAVLLTLVALGVQQGSSPLVLGALHGLKLLAVAVVAQAVWAMGRSLCPDLPRKLLALIAALLVLALPSAVGQPGALVLGALAGMWALPRFGRAGTSDHPAQARQDGHTHAAASPQRSPSESLLVSRRTGWAALIAFIVLLAGLSLLAHGTDSRLWAALWICYRASALVFGGGHVVLPMLDAGFVQTGWMSAEQFLAGYGAAQAVPGPLFTFAAYLGAAVPLSGVSSAWIGAGLLLLAIFAPAWLTLMAALPFWHALRQRAGFRNALTGINAAVVGLLTAALITPVASSALHSAADVLLVAGALVLLIRLRWPPLVLVLLMAGMGGGWALIG